MAPSINISNIPDDLPPGLYDAHLDNVRFVKCRDGGLDIVFEAIYRGPRSEDNPSLISFTKESPDGEGNSTQAQVQEREAQGQECK